MSRAFLTRKKPPIWQQGLDEALKVLPWLFVKLSWMHVKESFVFNSKHFLNLY